MAYIKSYNRTCPIMALAYIKLSNDIHRPTSSALVNIFLIWTSLRKGPTFGDATTGFPAKWRQRNERRNSMLMTRHYPDLGSASDWLNQISHEERPIRNTTHIWVVTRHQNGISALVSQKSFGGKTSGSGRDPFKQNFRKFRSKTQWIGSV